MKKEFILLLCAIICHTLLAQQQDEDIRDYFMPEKQKINVHYVDNWGRIDNSPSLTEELWEENGKKLYEVIAWVSNTPVSQTTMQLKITKNSIEVINSQHKGSLNPDSYYTKGSTLLKLPIQGSKNQWEWKGHIYTVHFEEDNGEKLLILKDFFKETKALLLTHVYAKGRGYIHVLYDEKIRFQTVPTPKLSQKEKIKHEIERKKIEEQKRLKRLKREEQKKQKRIKFEKEVRNRLTTADNIQDIEHQLDSLYNAKFLTELKKLSADNGNAYTLIPLQTEIQVEIDVWIRLDSAHCHIVKIDDDILDKRHSWLADSQLAYYCTINNEKYYKYQNDISYHREIKNMVKLCKEIFGLKYKNGHFKYYQTPPEKVQKWCQENIKTNGFHTIKYITHNYNKNNLYIIQETIVDKLSKKLLQKK